MLKQLNFVKEEFLRDNIKNKKLAKEENEPPKLEIEEPQKPDDMQEEPKPQELDLSKTNVLEINFDIDGEIKNSEGKDSQSEENGEDDESLSDSSVLKSSRKNTGVLKLKSLARVIISKNQRKNKQNKSIREYCKKYRDYILDLMELILNKEELKNCKGHIWNGFLLSSLSGLIGRSGSTLYPDIPIERKLADKWNIFTLLSFIKYSRPDFMEYALEVIYPEIKSLKYHEVPSCLDSTAQFNWFEKPTILLYGRMTMNPARQVSKMAERRKIKYRFIQLEELTLKEYEKIMIKAANQGEWIIIDNVQSILPSLSMSRIKLLLRGFKNIQISKTYKTWILYNLGTNSLKKNYNQGVMDRVPEWFSSCFKIYLNSNGSIFEEIMGLYSDDVNALYGSLEVGLGREIWKMQTRSGSSIGHQTVAMKRRRTIAEQSEEGDNIEIVNVHDQLFEGLVRRKLKFDEFKNSHSGELKIKISFLIALIRQKIAKIEDLHGKRFILVEEHLSDSFVNSIIRRSIDSIEFYVNEPFLHLFKYLRCSLFSLNRTNDFTMSPLTFLDYFDSLLYRSTTQTLHLNFSSHHYYLPGTSLSTSTSKGGKINQLPFTSLFNDYLSRFPYTDTPRILGFRTNEEILTNYTSSCNAFTLLSTHFKNTKIGDEKQEYVDAKTLNVFVELCAGSEKEVIESCSIDALGMSLETAKRIEGEGRPEEGNKGLTHVLLGMKDVQSGGEDEVYNGLHSNSNSKEGSLQVIEKAKKNQEKYPAERPQQLKDAIFGTQFSKKKIYWEEERDLEVKFEVRRNVLLDEYRRIKMIITKIIDDLTLARNYIEGEFNHRNKELAIKTLEKFYKNQVPQQWHDMVSTLNIDTSRFDLFVQSLMLRFDNLYYLVVELKDKIPPIINISRFLDPQRFLLNAAIFNSLRYDVK